jgi:hypothetical protein
MRTRLALTAGGLQHPLHVHVDTQVKGFGFRVMHGRKCHGLPLQRITKRASQAFRSAQEHVLYIALAH